MTDANGVTLRDVVADDIPVFFEHQLDVEACEMAGFPARSWDAFTSHWARILDDREIVARAVIADGRVAGNVVSFVQDGEREVGYWLGRDDWGRGVATLALSMFLTDEQRRPLYAHVAVQNLASRRVLQKCGFVLTAEDSDDLRFELRQGTSR
ncbi:MAG: GNAT family N-acetyltransferase [Chloroflexota bacterium]|nr:GNAT family N-acetyltransferase [Chloroflexota bacterium]